MGVQEKNQVLRNEMLRGLHAARKDEATEL
jgi:hypothetical protein